ncbi:MAG: hypothetical protein IKN54_02245 [Lachnospiraceae bacterium]|nr:hypothetical protein [Lachnospiraceae bacterium]
MSSHKMGRPTSEPKEHELKVRISEADKQKVEEIQNKTNMSKSDIVRAGINKVYEENI